MINKRHQGFFYETSFKIGVKPDKRHKNSSYSSSFKIGVKPDKRHKNSSYSSSFKIRVMPNKRGQVTIFIIIAVLIIGGIVAYFSLKENIKKIGRAHV